jgi:hypothetical protein
MVMDKSLFIFIMSGVGFLYFVTTFVGDIQAEEDKYQNKAYQEEEKYSQYDTVDSVGDTVLDVTGADTATQLKAWEKSSIKNDFLDTFPDFSTMKTFAKERVRGEPLVTSLMKIINSVEDKYFSGTITAEQAKRELGTLK